MKCTSVSAVLSVRQVDAAIAWYTTFFGRPADRQPAADLAEWHLPGGGAVHVMGDEVGGAGRSRFTLGVDHLDEVLAELERRDIIAESVRDSRGVRAATITDLDGNLILLTEPIR